MACLTNRTSPNSFSRLVFLKRKQFNNIPIFAKCIGWPLWKTFRPLANRHFSRLEWLVNYIEHHQTLSLDLFFQKRINFKISIFWQNSLGMIRLKKISFLAIHKYVHFSLLKCFVYYLGYHRRLCLHLICPPKNFKLFNFWQKKPCVNLFGTFNFFHH